MIESLYIENFAIIDQVQIDFQSGMTVLTGETGAGKSIIIDAIGQLIGQRSQPNFVKNGTEFAFIEGVFSSNEEIDKILLENNFPTDDQLVISKKISCDGKSTIKINYRNSSQLLLKKIMSQVVDIHSQFETHQLFNEASHLKLLDNYIGNSLDVLKKDYQSLYGMYKDLNKKYLSLTKEELSDEQLEFYIS
ncbi:MAG: AAA family ATPase, partial [Coprobacillus sp.]|nr:AAA family ATPase [Coprobacillus sp.]